jgi:hypothetical protein
MITANITLDQARLVKSYSVKGRNHLVINHGKVVDHLVREIQMIRDDKKRYYTTGKIKIAITPDDNDMIAAVEVFPSDFRIADSESLWIAISHSNSSRRGTHLYGCLEHEGVPVVCERYAVVKQRGIHFDPNANYAISEQIDNFIVQCGNFSNRIREMKRKYVSRPDMDIIMVQAARKKLFAWKMLYHVDNERKRLADGEEDRSAWTIYTAFALPIKKHCIPISHNPLTDQLRRMFDIRQMIMEYAV